MTAQELLQYSHEPYRQELIDGILYEMEPPGSEHGAVVGRTQILLGGHVLTHALGMTFAGDAGFRLASDPDTVRGPDVAFVARERIDAIGMPKGYWPGPPDLAIEVVSQHDRRSQVEATALVWVRSGTRVAVVLDPALRTATVYRVDEDPRILTADEPLDLDDVVPGFAPRVGDCFV